MSAPVVADGLPALPTPVDHTVADDGFEGAGVLSSWNDVVEAVDDGGAAGIAWSAGGAVLDTIGVAMNPLGELAGAGVGWLIEHVSFLHEPLDALAGDPIQIKGEAEVWAAVAARLPEIANRHVAGLATLDGWQGAAADAHRESAQQFAFALDRAGEAADEAASLVLDSGVGVATVRALIRDAVAGFVGEIIGAAIAAGIAALFTAGTSVAGFTLWTITRGVQKAAEIAERIAELLERLGEAGRRLAKLVERVDDLADGLTRGAAEAGRLGEQVREVAGRIDRFPGRLHARDGFTKRILDPVGEVLERGHRAPPVLAGGARHAEITNEDLLTHASDVAGPVVEFGKTATDDDWQHTPSGDRAP